MNISRTFFNLLAVSVMTLAPLTHAQTNNMSTSSITFLDKVYSPAWTYEPRFRDDSYSATTYLPEGETPPYFSNALSVDQDADTPVADSVYYLLEIARAEVLDTDVNLLEQIEHLKTGDTLLLFIFDGHDQERALITNSNGRKMLDRVLTPDAGEVVLVFVSNKHDKDRDEIVWDWDVYRYIPMQTTDGTPVIRRIIHTRKHYGNEGVSRFLNAIDVGNPRSEIINAVIAAQLPSPDHATP